MIECTVTGTVWEHGRWRTRCDCGWESEGDGQEVDARRAAAAHERPGKTFVLVMPRYGLREEAGEDSDPDTEKWREYVELPFKVAEEDALGKVLQWMSVVESYPRDSPYWTFNVSERLGWTVCLAEQITGSRAGESSLPDPDEFSLTTLLSDIVCSDLSCADVPWSSGIDWAWVRDYCAAWLRELHEDAEED